MNFAGVFSVLPTPFSRDGSIDFEGLKRVIDLFIQAGVNGFTALGVTSEVARLSDRERDAVLDSVLAQVQGRVPVIAGATADGRQTCIDYCRRAKSAGAAAVMVSPPRLLKLNSDAIVSHFVAVSAAVDMEIVVQDYPPVSGYTMEPALLVKIAREVPRARAIKLEDPPTPFKVARILEQCEGTPVNVLGGLGGVFLLEELLAGASGAMTGFAYPEMLVEIVNHYRAGNVDRAAEAFYRYVPLMRFEFQQGIGMAIRKEILRRRGVIAEAAIRLPGINLDDGTRKALDILLKWMKENQEVPWISV